MPIFIDSSETRSNSTMPHIENAIIVDNLEALTGCDLMLSRMSFPAMTQALIEQHLKNDAILVQRKHGRDLSASVGERMNNSLSKMRSLGARQVQCVLLFVGVMTEGDFGEAIINRQNAGVKYWQVLSALSRWHDRGGIVEPPLYSSKHIEKWCQMKLRHLEEYATKPERTFYPSNPIVHKEDKVLQVLMPVTDARITLCTFPGIGEKTATLLMDEFGSLASVLVWLSMPDTKTSTKVKGVGPITKKNAREWMELDEMMVLTQEVNEDLLEKAEKEREKKNE